MNAEWMCYLQQMQAYLQAQIERTTAMDQTIQQMRQELDQLREKCAQPQVIRNEYKFDLLKIEKLEGTLNIGLNPNATDSSIEEFAVTQTVDAPTKHAHLSNIQKQVEAYLQDEAYQLLKSMEAQYGHPLDDSYRTFILDDVKKQIDKRILHYLNQFPPDEAELLEESTVQRVIQDIQRTLASFVQHLPRQEKET